MFFRICYSSSGFFFSQNHPKIGEEIKEQLLRLNTLQLIDQNECMMQWQKFVQHPNLANYCFKYMETVTIDNFRIFKCYLHKKFVLTLSFVVDLNEILETFNLNKTIHQL